MQWKGRGKGFWFSSWQSKAGGRLVGHLWQRTLCSALHWIQPVRLGFPLSSGFTDPKTSPSLQPNFPCYFWFPTESPDPSHSPFGVLTSHCKFPSPLLLALDAFQSPAGVHTTILGKFPIVLAIFMSAPYEWQGKHCSLWGPNLCLAQQTCLRANHPFAARCSLARIKRSSSVCFMSSYCFLKKQTNGMLLDRRKSWC